MQGQGQRHVQKLRDAGEVAYQIGLHVAKSGSAGREMPQGGHAKCLARLLHRLARRHRCRGLLLVRVEKLLGNLERAELAVPSEDFVILGVIDRICV